MVHEIKNKSMHCLGSSKFAVSYITINKGQGKVSTYDLCKNFPMVAAILDF